MHGGSREITITIPSLEINYASAKSFFLKYKPIIFFFRKELIVFGKWQKCAMQGQQAQ